jgi:uncharacterized protein (TIGR02596 family)
MRKTRGFTLIELLVVSAIIVIMLTLVVPTVHSLLDASQLSQGTQNVANALAIARQTAFTRNAPVTLRLYRYADPQHPGEVAGTPSTGRYRGFQIFVNQGGAAGLVATQRAVELPVSVVINDGTLSSVLTGPGRTDTTANSTNPFVPVAGTNYIYQDLIINPAGDMQLTSGSTIWSLTIQLQRYPDSITTPPPNFATLVLNPINGTFRLYRP